ncbi:MAG TPA: YigZ family protein [Acholeplasmatales bacterium]|jgi:YigZ family protein|nr:YigZ family protein [Bacilli bacterium]MBS6562205.1 YigZ family protein [Staphylococcus sp.]CDC70060.1 putative uncharacterized protein [Staphylococcus sp. CAG:324]HAR57996.1 YigZ family protein [Acholeplasmatales bacterium]
MNTIKKEVKTIYEINKSRFITNIKPVKSVNEAKSFFLNIKKEFNDATHNVTVYIIGKTGEAGHYNDDGEPSGTAGLPVLDVFRKNEITNFACVVTRYFGGIKLGAGGLVRAYSTAASLALKEAQICEIIEYITLEIELNYPYLDIIENRLKNIEIISREFSTNVKLIIKIPQNNFEEIKNMLVYITNNMIKIRII